MPRVPRPPWGLPQRAAALWWLGRNRAVWAGKTIERYGPGRVSDAWLAVARGLKDAGIYAPGYYAWDMRVDKLVAEAAAALGVRCRVKLRGERGVAHG